MSYYFKLNNCDYIKFLNFNNKFLDFRNFDYYLKFNLFGYINKCKYLNLFKFILNKSLKSTIFCKILLTFNFYNIYYNKLLNNSITDINRFDLNNILFNFNLESDNYDYNINNIEENYFIKYYFMLCSKFNDIIFLVKNTFNLNSNKFINIYNIINLFLKDNKDIRYLYDNYSDKIIINKYNNNSINKDNKFYNKLILNNKYNNYLINYFIANKNIINQINNIDILNNFISTDLLLNNPSYSYDNFLRTNNINFNKPLYDYNLNLLFKSTSNVELNNINFNNIINILNVFKKNKKFEEYISNFIFGQENQLSKLSTIDINKIFSKQHINGTKPIGSWIICGPSGVGKTEIAKVISKLLYNDKLKFIKLDMSEFMDKYTVSRLIGAPPGYLGYEKGGELTNFVNNNPDSIILFDESEKANNYIYDLLLQVLDEGVLTDSKGTKVFFNKSILIFTSNLGADICKNNNDINTITSEVINELRKFFRIEFLNRLDDVIIFNYLNLFSIYKIMDKFFYIIKDKLCISNTKIKLILSLIFNRNNTNTRKIIRTLENNIINKIYSHKNIRIDICNKSLIYKLI